MQTKVTLSIDSGDDHDEILDESEIGMMMTILFFGYSKLVRSVKPGLIERDQVLDSISDAKRRIGDKKRYSSKELIREMKDFHSRESEEEEEEEEEEDDGFEPSHESTPTRIVEHLDNSVIAPPIAPETGFSMPISSQLFSVT
ncbi:hypothetical protein ADUPG1_010625 [Aduncisulcus paluster]|uniref:Uncharacterized protein n=1 Tax=Aduncisulcus paluster TaxID=2918883 RepID=A0ABQ5JTD4_9EUKA|nr:hypothetical protein ADUPG1_010625 [Aduncisulcus paluster]